MAVNGQNTKYLDLATRLRDDVRNGRLKPGDRLPSFIELRNEHSISRGTVEKVHALLEKDGLIVREQGRGVFVASPKQRPASKGIIGFCGGGFSETRNSLFWAHLLSGIQQEAASEKFQLLLVTETSDQSIWGHIDGLLVSSNEEEIYKMASRIPDGLPCVSILQAVDDLSSVTVNDYRASRDVTEHLLELGHTKIGQLISGYDHLVEHRLDGYRDALQDAGIEPSLNAVRLMHLRPGRDSKAEFIEQGRRAIRGWLDTGFRDLGYSAVIAQNDNAAVGAIEAFVGAGVRVPEDVSVVGFDGNEIYDYFTPRLTTVDVPIVHIGAAAARMLSRRIREPGQPIEKISLAATLKVGDSTGPKLQAPG